MLDELKRILFIAIVGVGVCVGSTEVMGAAPAPVLDFDTIAVQGTNIPNSFQPKWNNNVPANINAPNGQYIYFTVVPNGGGVAGNAPFAPLNIQAPVAAAQQAPVAGDINVYFPADGHQPTTLEAVAWSCANIDNREDSPITEWYMKMFGVIPFQNTGNPANDYMKAGWKNFQWKDIYGNDLVVPLRSRAIAFDVSVDNTQVDDPSTPGQHIGRRDLFVREFRKIASTSVGRVLLYRILIEIRRHLQNSNIGVEALDVSHQTEMIQYMRQLLDTTRNESRSIIISAANKNEFIPGKIFLTFAPSGLTVIGKLQRDGDKYFYSVVTQTSSIDIGIFHEFGHLYHSLRNIERYYEEARNDHEVHFLGNSVSKYFYDKFRKNCLGYRSKFPNSVAQSELIWVDISLSGLFYIPFEEMRNILGMPYFESSYLQGDDICENLYRANKVLPLRFGYGFIKQYYEDFSVVNREMSTIYNSLILYGTLPLNTNMNFEYKDKNNWKGLGNCKIKSTDVPWR